MNATIPACILLGTMLAVALPVAARETSDGAKSISFEPVPIPPETANLIPADNPAIRYEGRVDQTKPAAPRINWQATRVVVDFEGPELTVLLELATSKAVADIIVDGIPQRVELTRGKRAWRLEGALDDGWHQLVIFKRSEASAGAMRFRGIVLKDGATVRESAYKYQSRMIFFGDSITAGACNEDGATDQWDSVLTHNSAKSYGVLFAKAVNADVQNIAISGMGMVTGWNNTIYAPQVWNRYAPVARGSLADLESWIPDVVFTNFGENDASYTQANGNPFPAEYVDTYIDYIKTLRKTWPKAAIVILRGGMHHGKNDPNLADAVDRVREAFKDDTLVYSYNFVRWTGTHPRVADHQAMADELVTFFKQNEGLKGFIPVSQ